MTVIQRVTAVVESPTSPAWDPVPSVPVARTTAQFAAAAYLLVVIVLRLFVRDVGWAASDDRNYHFPVINYFLSHGFNDGYPNLLAMFPGMHVFFAAIAKVLGVSHLAYNGIAAFLIQSIWGLLLLLAVYRLLISVCTNGVQVAAAALIIFSSSYTLYSWLWPTTELGTLAFFVGMLATLSARVGHPWRQRALFSVGAALSVLFRQSSVTLAAAMLLSNAPAARRQPQMQKLLANLLPIACAAAVLAVIAWHWQGLVPPGFERHESHRLNWVTAVHVVALTGLIGWPFAWVTLRLLRGTGRVLWICSALSAAAVAVCMYTLPLGYSFAQGRRASLVWDIQAKLGHAGMVFMAASLIVGFWIWIGIAALCWRERRLRPEIALFACFAAGFLLQAFSWQRYVEPELLITLAVFYAPRIDARRAETAMIFAWFGLYAALSLAKASLGLSAA